MKYFKMYYINIDQLVDPVILNFFDLSPSLRNELFSTPPLCESCDSNVRGRGFLIVKGKNLYVPATPLLYHLKQVHRPSEFPFHRR